MRVLLAFALLALLPRLEGCSCVGLLNPCYAAGSAEAAFTGTVLGIIDHHPARPAPARTGGPAPGNRLPASRDGGDPMPQLAPSFRVVRLRVGEVLSGVDQKQKEIEIVTGTGGGDCGFPFELGTDYVVYAYKNGAGRLETGICSGTRPVAGAAEHIEYFRAMANAPETGELRVYTRLADNPGKPGVWMTVEREGSRYSTQTDAAGVATFTGLPPGEYVISAVSDLDLAGKSRVKLNAKGCRSVTFFPPTQK